MLRKLGKLLLIGTLLLALVAIDSLAPSFAKATEDRRLQRPRKLHCPPLPPAPPKLPDLPFGRRRPRRPRHSRRVNLNDPCQTARSVTQSLQTLDPRLLSENLTQTFSSEALGKAIQKSAQKFGQITKVKAVGHLEILDGNEWMTQEVQLTTDKGITQKFLVVYHREGGEWKLFGTLRR